jgi:2,5-dihydroxypyridine 5,6-dioxygenase
MPTDRIEGKWIDCFAKVFELCELKAGDTAAILSETQSRQLNVQPSVRPALPMLFSD